jgi:hypothetical protein
MTKDQQMTTTAFELNLDKIYEIFGDISTDREMKINKKLVTSLDE